MRKNSYLTLGFPQIRKEDIKEVAKVIKSGCWINGPKAKKLAKCFTEYIGCDYSIPVCSGTAALHLALDCLNIKAGDEVITTPFTFPSTAHVITYVGAKPVFVDIDRDTFNIDPKKIKKAVNKKTKAIIPVHIAGYPCEMDEITDIAKKYNLYVIEDATHAVEAWYKDKKIGTISDLTCFSFDVTKNIAGGMGGMIVTTNKYWAEKIKNFSHLGIVEKKFSLPNETIYPGYRYDMTEFCATIALNQLKRVEKNLRTREKYWNMYNKAFAGIQEITIPKIKEIVKHSRHLYMVLLNFNKLTYSRSKFMEDLASKGVGTRIRFSSIHLHKYYREKYNFKKNDFPVSEEISDRVVCLPLSAALSEKDIKYIISAVNKTIKKFKK